MSARPYKLATRASRNFRINTRLFCTFSPSLASSRLSLLAAIADLPPLISHLEFPGFHVFQFKTHFYLSRTNSGLRAFPSIHEFYFYINRFRLDQVRVLCRGVIRVFHSCVCFLLVFSFHFFLKANLPPAILSHPKPCCFPASCFTPPFTCRKSLQWRAGRGSGLGALPRVICSGSFIFPEQGKNAAPSRSSYGTL